MATIIAKAQATITDLNDGTGVTITECWVKYAYWTPSDGATPPDASDSGWTEDLESVTDGLLDGEGYWTWTHVKYSDGTQTNAYSLTAKGETGDTGETGEDGKDALVVNVSPSALVFNASNKGIVANATAQAQPATITARYGTKTATVSDLTITSQDNCTAGVSGTKVTISSISQTSAGVTDSDGNIIYVSASSGSVSVSGTAKLGTRSEQFNVTIPFTVNMAAKFGSLIANDEQFSSKLAEVTTKNGELETKYSSLEQTASALTSRVGTLETTTDGLQDSYSEISQKTDQIALKVGQTTLDSRRTNLIAGGMLHVLVNTARFTLPNRYKMEAGKTYTVTINGRSSSTDYYLCVYVYNKYCFLTSTKTYSGTPITTDTTLSFTVTPQIDVPSGVVYVDCFKKGSTATRPTSTAYYAVLNWITIEEGSVSTGAYSLKEGESYALPNLLRGTQSFTTGTEGSGYAVTVQGAKSGTTEIDGQTLDVFYKYNTAASTDFIWANKALAKAAAGVYTLSFYAKASSASAQCYLGMFITQAASASTNYVVMGGVNSAGQADGTANSDGCTGVATLTTGWKQYWVTFKLTAAQTDMTPVIMRMFTTGVTYYIAGVKLREGGRPDPWTDYGISAPTAAALSLLPTGIDIEQRKLTLTSDNVEVRNNAGQTTALLDSDGNLTAKTLNSTPDDSYGAAITVSGGTLTVKGQGEAKIVLGLDSDGYATLSFYGLDGTKLYDLGPDGISLVRSASWIDKVTLVDLSIFGITSLADGATCSATVNPQLFTTPTSYQTVTLYRYHAYRVNGVAQADGNYGFDSSDADAADNKLFSVISGSVATAASGNFMEQNPTGLALVQSAQSSSVYRWRKFFYNVNSDGEQTTRRCYCSQEAYRKINGIEEGSD